MSTITPHADTVAISAGIGAFSANFSFIDVAPGVQAYIGSDASVNTSGAVTVTASSTTTAEADMFGVSAGEYAVGVSYTQLTLSPDVVAELGDPNVSGSGEREHHGRFADGDSGYAAQWRQRLSEIDGFGGRADRRHQHQRRRRRQHQRRELRRRQVSVCPSAG